jgi:hypothetical protein
VAEGAPLLREYRVKSLIEGSNPSLSAKHTKALICQGFFVGGNIAFQATGRVTQGP